MVVALYRVEKQTQGANMKSYLVYYILAFTLGSIFVTIGYLTDTSMSAYDYYESLGVVAAIVLFVMFFHGFGYLLIKSGASSEQRVSNRTKRRKTLLEQLTQPIGTWTYVSFGPTNKKPPKKEKPTLH